MAQITWEQLVGLEPRLRDLEYRVRHAADGKDCYCYETVWYADYKRELTQLIGWKRKTVDGSPVEESLHGSVAYHVAYEHLLQALPNCRKCSLHMSDEIEALREAGIDVSDWC